MIIINFDEYNLNRKAILSDVPKSLFVYPSDTMYCLGCNASDERLVARIRSIKQSQKPFSIIVPEKKWIYDNCVVTEEAEEWIRKLPGPYTLILRLKNPKAVARNVLVGDGTIAVRMPNHWFLAISFQAKTPIICTSANITGDYIMTSLDDLDVKIRNNVDYIFYDGPKRGAPSTMVHLEGESVEIHPKFEHRQKRGIDFPLEEIKLAHHDN